MEHSFEHLYNKIKNSNSEVRANAVRELGRLQLPQSTDILAQYTNDLAPEVRRAVADALGNVHDNRAIEHLLAMIRSETDRETRADIFNALDEYNAPTIEEYLIREAFHDKTSRFPRQEVARQLRKYNTEASVDTLVELVRDEDFVVFLFAVDSLIALNRPRLLTIWQKLTSHGHPYVEKTARKAIKQLTKIKDNPKSM